VETIASRLGRRKLQEVLEVFRGQLALDNAHFAVADLDPMIELATRLDDQAGALTLRDRFIYAQAPVDTRTDAQVTQFLDWAHGHATNGKAGVPWFLDAVDSHSRLDRMEQALRSCTLWLWLDLRFPGIYGEVPEVLDRRSRLNDGIERQLKGQRPLWQARGGHPRGRR
jgi:ATP-dependent RNA helicase SUPV3L1/SUV3